MLKILSRFLTTGENFPLVMEPETEEALRFGRLSTQDARNKTEVPATEETKCLGYFDINTVGSSERIGHPVPVIPSYRTKGRKYSTKTRADKGKKQRRPRKTSNSKALSGKGVLLYLPV